MWETDILLKCVFYVSAAKGPALTISETHLGGGALEKVKKHIFRPHPEIQFVRPRNLHLAVWHCGRTEVPAFSLSWGRSGPEGSTICEGARDAHRSSVSSEVWRGLEGSF